MVCRAPIATATIANVRKGTSPVEDTVTVEVTVRFKVFETLKLFSGKKYCYGGMEGEYCHCDYCKVFLLFKPSLSSTLFAFTHFIVVRINTALKLERGSFGVEYSDHRHGGQGSET